MKCLITAPVSRRTIISELAEDRELFMALSQQPRAVAWAVKLLPTVEGLLGLPVSLAEAADLVGSRTPEVAGLGHRLVRAPLPPARMATGTVVRVPPRSMDTL